MKVSVVIPTYNRAKYLPEALKSVLTQTFVDFELVVVDDGSTDNTAEIVRAMADPRIRYIAQSNRGVAGALNTGWRAARGEYIGRLDSDDVWLPNLLQELVPILERNPEMGVVYARAQWMDADGKQLPQILGTPEKFPGENLKSLLYGDCVCPIAVVFRVRCIESVGGYDDRLAGNEDWDLWIRMAEHYGIGYVDSILARYRVHSGNSQASRTGGLERLAGDRVRVLEKYYSRPGVPKAAESIKPIAFRNVYQDIAIRHLYSRHWRAAGKYIGLATNASPQPLTFLIRFAGVALYYMFLSKRTWGVRLMEAFVARRRRISE